LLVVSQRLESHRRVHSQCAPRIMATLSNRGSDLSDSRSLRTSFLCTVGCATKTCGRHKSRFRNQETSRLMLNQIMREFEGRARQPSLRKEKNRCHSGMPKRRFSCVVSAGFFPDIGYCSDYLIAIQSYNNGVPMSRPSPQKKDCDMVRALIFTVEARRKTSAFCRNGNLSKDDLLAFLSLNADIHQKSSG
jgi:hypothetical protein